MRKSRFSFNIAYCGIMCAMAALVMFAAIIPSMTYVMPAVSGIIIWTVSSQVNRKWAVLTYVSAALLTLLMPGEPESKAFFVLVFGYYPILREIIAKIPLRIVRLLLKLAFFNITASIAFLIAVKIFMIPLEAMLEGMEGFGDYAVYALLGFGNVAFFCYDFALKYVEFAFTRWIKPNLNKKIK